MTNTVLSRNSYATPNYKNYNHNIAFGVKTPKIPKERRKEITQAVKTFINETKFDGVFFENAKAKKIGAGLHKVNSKIISPLYQLAGSIGMAGYLLSNESYKAVFYVTTAFTGTIVEGCCHFNALNKAPILVKNLAEKGFKVHERAKAVKQYVRKEGSSWYSKFSTLVFSKKYEKIAAGK